MNGKRYCTVVHWSPNPWLGMRIPVGVLIQTGAVECEWHRLDTVQVQRDQIDAIAIVAQYAADTHHYKQAVRRVQNVSTSVAMTEFEVPPGEHSIVDRVLLLLGRAE